MGEQYHPRTPTSPIHLASIELPYANDMPHNKLPENSTFRPSLHYITHLSCICFSNTQMNAYFKHDFPRRGPLLKLLEKLHFNFKELTHVYIRNCSRKWSNSGTRNSNCLQ